MDSNDFGEGEGAGDDEEEEEEEEREEIFEFGEYPNFS